MGHLLSGANEEERERKRRQHLLLEQFEVKLSVLALCACCVRTVIK